MTITLDERQLNERFANMQRQRGPQSQDRDPGLRSRLDPKPDCGEEIYEGSGKLKGKAAIITGGDSGIGRAAAIALAREGADVAISYLDENEDASDTARWIKDAGRKCETFAGDIGDRDRARSFVERAAESFGRLDIVINNAATQRRVEDPEDITEADLVETFRTNIFSYFFVVNAALKHMKEAGSIINTTSVVAYAGHEQLITYSATKGAIVAYTRSLAQALTDRKIRVNAVAPGPVWTPLIAATFPEDETGDFGEQFPMKRAAQPVEMASSFVFLACADSSFMTGQVLHPNGGVIIGV